MKVLFTQRSLKVTLDGVAPRTIDTGIINIPFLVDAKMRLVKPVNAYFRDRILKDGHWSSPYTWKSYADAICEFFLYLEDNELNWRDATAKMMGLWRDSQLRCGASGKPLSPNTVADRMIRVQNFYEWANANGEVTTVPFVLRTRTIRYRGDQPHLTHDISQNVSAPKRVPVDIMVPTRDDIIKRFMPALHSRHYRLMAWLLYETGLRKRELITLNVDAVNAVVKQAGNLWDRPKPLRLLLNPKRMQIKGNKPRWVELSSALAHALGVYLRSDRPRLAQRYHHKHGIDPTVLFLSSQGNAFSDTTINVAFRQASERAGLNYIITVHLLRHAFATHTLMFSQSRFGSETQTLQWLQRRLGHASVQTTAEKYIHLQPDLVSLDQAVFDTYQSQLSALIEEGSVD